MIKYSSFKIYNHVVDGLRFPPEKNTKYMITYFSENSSFLQDFSRLNIRLIDIRTVVIPYTKYPLSKLDITLRKEYRKIGMFAFQSNQPIPDRNIYYDLSNYFSAIDTLWHPDNYRMRVGTIVKRATDASTIGFEDYHKILFYSVDLTKPFDKNYINRKFYPILMGLKEGDFYFDDLVLVSIGSSGARYRLLVKDKQFIFARAWNYIKSIKLQPLAGGDEEEQEDVEDASNEVSDKVSQIVPQENKEKVKSAISSYLRKSPEEAEKATNKQIDNDDAAKIATKAILYQATGSLTKSKMAVDRVPREKTATALKAVDKNFTDQILDKGKAVNSSGNLITKSSNIPAAVDNKNPSHLFQKRQIDFEKNLQKDLNNSFAVLERKEVPLKIEKIEIVDKSQRKGEINKSDIITVNVVLRDQWKKSHRIHLDLPKIDPNSGTFRVNGKTKCLINQIVLCPITFPKKYESKFESSYAIFRIYSKRTARHNYLEAYIASHKLPLLILMAYSFGFGDTLKRFGIGYQLTVARPDKDDIFYKLVSGNYIVFENIKTEVQIELVKSFLLANVSKYNIEKEFGTKEYFNDLIIAMTGKRNSTYLINQNLENIVDPVVKQVLLTQHLPTELEPIMFYMANKVVTGFAQDRNDISNQRIRGSEVLVHLTQKQILAAYTVYKEQVLAGNKDAKFAIPQQKVISDFVRSEIVTNMEYANPVEEMAVLTRISPVGKAIGGIPDKDAIQTGARNVHPSYFGNIDPLDTPEGGNIGVVQQLAIDAMITSARGLFQIREITNKEGGGILSTSASMIPFVENNEGARITMATQQSRQMVPLKNPEAPAIQSGYESLLTSVLSNNFIKRSPCDGKVANVTPDSIILMCNKKGRIDIDISPVHLKSGSGKDTLSIFNVKVSKGQSVKVGQIIAEGSSISNGTIALGRTLCTAYMPYKGYNFEDGIVISESLVRDDKLTSLHGIMDEVLISENDKVLYIAPIGVRTSKGDPLLRKTLGELEQIFSYEEEEGEEVTSGQFIKKSPGGTVVDIEVYSNVDISKYPLLKELSDRTKKKNKIVSDEKFTVHGNIIKGILVKFKIEQELKIEVSDKLCNRYGNKGIVSLVEKEENMPRTPWGEKVEIILNPLGIINRMNVGQLYELYCGLISKTLATRIVEYNSQAKAVQLLRLILPKLDNTVGKKISGGVISYVASLSATGFKNLVIQIKTFGFIPLIIPPFKSPSLDQVMEALKLLGLKAGYNLYLPEYNTKTEYAVPVGYSYASKLEHIGAMKIYGRSTGPVTGKTGQPTSGKRREGGQRMGEQDTYSLISYNCPALIAEFFGPLSDDAVSKNEIISDIIQRGHAEFRPAKVSPVKDLLTSYFISLMLERY